MNKKICLFTALIFFALVLSSCNTDLSYAPYAVKSKTVRIGSYSSYYNFAGAHIVFSNKSNKVVRQVTLSFLVFDSDGQLSSPVGNAIVTVHTEKIKPLDSKEIIVSLDDALGPHLFKTYQVGNLFASEIVFSDGSVWSDPMGFYAE